MKKIIILGTGGNCNDILDTITDINRLKPTYECIGFLDDNENNWGKIFFGINVLGPLNSAKNYNNCYFVNGIGSPNNFWKKKDIIKKTNIPIDRFETIIHPSASVSNMSFVGKGSVIFQNVTVTSNVRIGNHVVVLPNSIISHDTLVGDYTCITGGVCISGNVSIGKSSYLGTGSSIKNGINVGNMVLIGMGSTVLNDVKHNTVVAGTPAKFLRKVTEA